MVAYWVRAGIKIVCIDPDWSSPDGSVDFPSLGEVYTISDVLMRGKFISLEEFDQDLMYTTYSFRPLVRIEDDMKLFEHLKNPSLVDKLDLLAERMNDLAED